MEERPYILPLDTLSQEEGAAVGPQLNSWPENLKSLALGFETAEFIRNLSAMYSLTAAQQRGVARFVIDAILRGGIPTSQSAPALAETAQVDANTSVQLMKEIEVGLLEPAGLTLTGLTAPAGQPEVVLGEEGNAELRYASADDLLADIAELTPEQRDRFLSDAKPDNRVIVLQTLSQLKLGADRSGRPLSFRQLTAAEAGEFTVRDWADLARTDPDALAEPDIVSHIADTPLGAMLQGRDPAAARDIVLQFRALDSDAQRVLVSRETAAELGKLVRPGLVPPTHAAAVGRIVFFVVTGQARPENVAGLLAKVGLNAAAADAVARTVSTLTTPVPGTEEVAEIPPVPAPQRTPGLNVPNAGSRTILDLRSPRP